MWLLCWFFVELAKSYDSSKLIEARPYAFHWMKSCSYVCCYDSPYFSEYNSFSSIQSAPFSSILWLNFSPQYIAPLGMISCPIFSFSSNPFFEITQTTDLLVGINKVNANGYYYSRLYK